MVPSQLIQRVVHLLKQNWELVLFGCIHILIFTVFFKSGWIFGKFLQDDFTLSYIYSSKIMLGQLPYLDFPVEYPPLALVFMLLPRLFSANPDIYAGLFNAEMLLFDLIGLLLITAIARQLGKSIWKTLAVYTLALAAIGPLIVVRYDIIPAIVLLAALYLFLRGHSSWSWAFLAIGAMTKIFPLVAVLLLLISQLKKRQYTQIARGAGAFILAVAIIAIPVLIFSPQGLLDSLTYHTGRSLQCETTYASFLLLAQSLGFGSLEIVNSSGSTNVVSPLADALASWSTPIMVLLLLVIYWLYYLRLSREANSTQATGAAGLINYFFLSVLVFVLSYKVFSPQFIIWFFPLIPLLTTRWGNLPWLIFVMAALMTAFVYPKDYGGLEYGEMLAIGMLVLRNVALIVLVILVINKAQRKST